MTTTKQDLTVVGSTVFYRDKLDGGFTYVEGVVTDVKPVEAAEAEWDQKWSQDWGQVLEITPIEKVEEQRKKYRHIGSCQTPETYKEWITKRASGYTERLAKVLEEE